MQDFFERVLQADDLSRSNRQIPETVKKNALAELYNIVCVRMEDIKALLSEHQRDEVSAALQDIIQAGPIHLN